MNSSGVWDKTRALFLAALMITSVFAGTVALSAPVVADVTGVNSASATDATIDDGSAENTITVNVSSDSNSENVTVDLSALPTNVTVTDATPSGSGNLTVNAVTIVDNGTGGNSAQINANVSGEATNATLELTVNYDVSTSDDDSSVTVDITAAGSGQDATAVSDDFNFDTARPTVNSATTGDANDDGSVDEVTVTFSENLSASTVEAGDFSVESGSVDSVGVSGDTVTLTVSGVGDTAATPNVTVADGSVEDTAGNQLSGDKEIEADDGADPVVLDTSLNQTVVNNADAPATVQANITFSENVLSGQGSVKLSNATGNRTVTGSVSADKFSGTVSIPDDDEDTVNDLIVEDFNDGDGNTNDLFNQSGAVVIDTEESLTLNSAETADQDNDGVVDTVNVTFSDDINDTTVISAIEADEFNLRQGTVVGLADGGDNDNTVSLNVENVGNTGATDEVTLFSNSIEDTAGNPGPNGPDGTPVTDGADPVVLSLTVNDTSDGNTASSSLVLNETELPTDVTINATFSENLDRDPTTIELRNNSDDSTRASATASDDGNNTISASTNNIASAPDDGTLVNVVLSGGDDGAGNSVEFNETRITVDGVDPAVTVEDPIFGGDLQSGPVDISDNVSVSDGNGIEEVELAVDDGDGLEQIDSFDSVSALNTALENFNTTQFSDGTLTIQLNATDVAGNTNTASGALSVDNTAPDVTIVEPAETQAEQSNSSLTVEADVTEANPTDPATVTLTSEDGFEAVYEVQVSQLENGVDLRLNVSQNATAGDGVLPVQSRTDDNFTFDTQTLYDLSVTVNDSTGKSTTATQADVLFLDDTDPANFSLIAPADDEPQEVSGGDSLVVAYGYTENNTASVTVNLTDEDGTVVRTVGVDESQYTDDGVIKSFEIEDGAINFGGLADDRYNVSVTVADDAGNELTDNTTNAPIAVNKAEEDNGDIAFNSQDATADLNETSEQVTVNVSYNVSVQDLTDAGDLEQVEAQLEDVTISPDADLVTASLTFYDESREEYRTIGSTGVPLGNFEGIQEVDNQTVTATATTSVNITDVFNLDDSDRVLDYTVDVNSGAPIDITAFGNTDVPSESVDVFVSSDSATLVDQDPLEPRIESVEVVGPDTPDTQLNITFTRPVQETQPLTSSDFGYQDVSGDGSNFIDSADINGDTVTVTLESAVDADDVSSDIVSLQDDSVLETDPTGTAISPVTVSPDNGTVEETDAPAISGDAAVSQNASVLTVRFDQPVAAADDSALTADNVTYSGDAVVVSVDHEAETDTVTVTLNESVTSDEAGTATVTFDTVSDRFNNTAEGLSTTVEDFLDPSDIAIDAPSERTVVQSSTESAEAADDGTRFLDVTYRYVENIPDGPADVDITLTQEQGEGDSFTSTVNDVEFVNENTTKTVTLDLNETGGLADGVYSVEVSVTDQAGNNETASTDAVVVVNDEAPDVPEVTVTPSGNVAPDDTIEVGYNYDDATNATSVTVHVVEVDDVNNFTAGDFENAAFEQVQVDVDDGSFDQSVDVDLSELSIIDDNSDYAVLVTATDESGFTNLNTSANPIIQQESQVPNAALDVNDDAPAVESVETDAGSRTVTVTFSEPVVPADDDLARDDFAYQDVSDSDASAIESVAYGDSRTEVVLTLDADVSAGDLSTDLIEVRSGAIVDTDGDDLDNARAVPLTATALNDTTDPTVTVTAGSVNAQNADNLQVDVTTEPLSEPTNITVTATGSDGETVNATASVTDDTTVALNVSALADGEVTISVEATDVAGNSGSQSTASTTVTKDTVAPTIESATTNAGTSTVNVTFSEPVTDVAANAFSITSPVHEVDSVSQQDATTVVLTLNRSVPPAAINVSGVQVSATGVSDSVGNDVTNEVNFTDVEAPSIEAVSAERNSSTVTVTFTEVITGGGESQNLTAEDFEYADNSNTSVSGIVSVNKTGPQTAVLTVNGSFTPSDLAEDTVAVAPESVFDTVDNAATSNAVGLGFEASLDASSTNDTVTIRVVTAQNITDAVDSLQVTERNVEFAELEGFETNDRFETSLNASEFTEVEPGVFETAIELPRDDTYTVSGVVSSTFQTETTTVDTSVPEPTDAVVLEVTSEAQLDDSRETTRLRVLFDEPIDASQISPDDVTVGGLDGEIVAVQDAGAFGAVEVIVEGDLQTGDSPEISIAGSSYTDLNGTQGVENGSTVIHTDVVQLNEGVNLVSVPAASGSLDISELPLDAIESISRYNAETDSFEVFVPGAPNNPFTTLDGGEGYIIRLENGTTASVAINVANEPTGEGGPNSVDLSEGLNLIGHYQEDQQAVTTALSSVTAGQDGQFSDTVFTVLSQDEEAGGFTYESFRAGEFSTMEDGEAYWVFVTEDETYTEAPFDDR